MALTYLRAKENVWGSQGSKVKGVVKGYGSMRGRARMKGGRWDSDLISDSGGRLLIFLGRSLCNCSK